MKALVGAFNQEKAPVIVKPMDRFTALVKCHTSHRRQFEGQYVVQRRAAACSRHLATHLATTSSAQYTRIIAVLTLAIRAALISNTATGNRGERGEVTW